MRKLENLIEEMALRFETPKRTVSWQLRWTGAFRRKKLKALGISRMSPVAEL